MKGPAVALTWAFLRRAAVPRGLAYVAGLERHLPERGQRTRTRRAVSSAIVERLRILSVSPVDPDVLGAKNHTLLFLCSGRTLYGCLTTCDHTLPRSYAAGICLQTARRDASEKVSGRFIYPFVPEERPWEGRAPRTEFWGTLPGSFLV